MGNAQPPSFYAWGTIIANEVKIYSFPCSVKITFGSIKTSSINIVLGPEAIPGREIKKYSFCREVAGRAAPLNWFVYLSIFSCREWNWRRGFVFCSGWWKRRDEPCPHLPPHHGETLIRRCTQAVMDDFRHGLAKYELGIKPSNVILKVACW